MRRFVAAIVLSVACALVLSACGGDDGTSVQEEPTLNATQIAERVDVLPKIRLGYPPSGSLLVEVAITPDEVMKGLGYRDSLFDQGGMLFDLGSTRMPSFWMKGMRFPLDMVWIDETKKVVEVDANVQPEPGVADAALKRYAPDAPVRYVLELNAGKAASAGIAPGTQLDFTIPDTLFTPPTVAIPTTRGLPPSPVLPTPAN